MSSAQERKERGREKKEQEECENLRHHGRLLSPLLFYSAQIPHPLKGASIYDGRTGRWEGDN